MITSLEKCGSTSLFFCLSVFFSLQFILPAQGQLPEPLWLEQVGGGNGGSAITTSIARLSGGDYIIAGSFKGLSDFDPGPGIALRSTSSSSNFDPFIARYTSDGLLVWVRQLRSTSSSELRDLDIDSEGNIYVVGYLLQTMFPNEEDLSISITSNVNNSSDIFTASYDANGNYRWAKQFGSFSVDTGRAIAVGENNVYVTGVFSQTADLDPSDNSFEVIHPSSGQRMFVASYNKSDGSFDWGFSIDGSGTFDLSYDLCLDDQENLYLTGAMRGTNDFDPGPNLFTLTGNGSNDDLFLASYTTSGAFRWAWSSGSSFADYGTSVHWSAGSVFLTGIFRSTVDFDPGVDVNNQTSNGNNDVFLGKYADADGALEQIVSFGGTGNDIAGAVTTNPAGDIFLTGAINGSADLNPLGAPQDLTTTGSDGFIASYSAGFLLNWSRQLESESLSEGNALNWSPDGLAVAGAYRGNTDFNLGGSPVALEGGNADRVFGARFAPDSGGLINAWTVTRAQTGGNDELQHVRSASNGDLYVSGFFNDNAYLPGQTETISSLDGQGVFFGHLNSSGEFINIGTLTGDGNCTIAAMEMDGNDQVYFAAAFFNTATLSFPSGDVLLSGNGSQQTMVWGKLDAQLNLVWHQVYTGAGLMSPSGLAINGNQIALTGRFRGSKEITPSIVLTSFNLDDVFLASFDLDGNCDWAYSFGGSSNDQGVEVGFDGAGNIVLAASIRNTVNMDPAGQADPIIGASFNRIVFASYTTAGTYNWAHINADSNTSVSDIQALNANEFLIYGRFPNSNTFGAPGEEVTLSSEGFDDLFVLRYTNAGSLQEGFALVSGVQDDEPGEMIVTDGSILFTGGANLDAQFNSSSEAPQLSNSTSQTAFIVQYDFNLDIVASFVAGGGGSSYIRSLAQSGDDWYAAGGFIGIKEAGNLAIGSYASLDGFLLKLGAPAQEPCSGDYDLDGGVGSSDLLILLSQFGCTSGCTADLNGDDQVNVSDILLFLASFGTICN